MIPYLLGLNVGKNEKSDFRAQFSQTDGSLIHPRAFRDVCPLADYRAPDGDAAHAAAPGSEERRVKEA